MTTIKYSEERLKGNLKMSLFFIFTGLALILIHLFIGDWKDLSLNSIGGGQLGAGIFMLIYYLYENKKQYLTLKNGELIKNSLFPKKVKLSEIQGVKEFAGDLKLLLPNRELVIDTQMIEPHSLIELKNILKSQGLNWY